VGTEYDSAAAIVDIRGICEGILKVGIKNKYIGVVNGEELLAFLRTFLGYHNHTLSIHYPYTIHTPSIHHSYNI